MVAIELAVMTIMSINPLSDVELLIHGDNTAVIAAIKKGRSRNESRNHSIRRISTVLISNNIIISPLYTPSEENPADPISRGTLGLPELYISPTFSLPDELKDFVFPTHV